MNFSTISRAASSIGVVELDDPFAKLADITNQICVALYICPYLPKRVSSMLASVPKHEA